MVTVHDLEGQVSKTLVVCEFDLEGQLKLTLVVTEYDLEGQVYPKQIAGTPHLPYLFQTIFRLYASHFRFLPVVM